MTTDPTTTTAPTFLVDCHYQAASSWLWNTAVIVLVVCAVIGLVAIVRSRRAS